WLGFTGVSDASVQRLRAALPKCKISVEASLGPAPRPDPNEPEGDRRAAEWALSIGGTIRIRQDGQERDILAAKDLPATPFTVLGVNFRDNQKVDDAVLEHLTRLTNLTQLGLNHTKVSDAGLVHLQMLT